MASCPQFDDLPAAQDIFQTQSQNNQAVPATKAQQGSLATTKNRSWRVKKKPVAPLAVNPGPQVPHIYLPRPLQAGWISLFDPASRLPFYFHPATQRSQWQAPLVPLPALPPPWVEASEPTRGLPYYYNPLTKTSQWERPTGSSLHPERVGLPQKLAPASFPAATGKHTGHAAAAGRITSFNGAPTTSTSALLNGPSSSTASVQIPVAQNSGPQLNVAQRSAAQLRMASNRMCPTQNPALQLPAFQTPPVWTPAVQIPPTPTLVTQTIPVQTTAVQFFKVESSAIISVHALQTPAVRHQSAVEAHIPRVVQCVPTPNPAPKPVALSGPATKTPFPTPEAVQIFASSAFPQLVAKTEPSESSVTNGLELAPEALHPAQSPVVPRRGSVVTTVARQAAFEASSSRTSVPALTAPAEAGENAGVNPKTPSAEAAQGPSHTEHMEVAQEPPAVPHPTAENERVGMAVEAGPDDLIESVADLPIPCLECACLGPVTRVGLCRTCAKLPTTASPALLQLSPVPQILSEPASKRGRKRSKPPLYTSPPARAAELASNGLHPPVQLPDDILETIVKMVAVAKPRSNSQTLYQGFYAYSYRGDSEYELRVDERLTARDLANLCQVAKDWKQGVESVGWATLLDGIAETCRPASDVRKGQKDGNANVTLQAMHAASMTIVATKAAAEYKVKTEELRAQAKPFKVKRNPHRRSGQMRIYNVKDVLDLALAKHGGAVGLCAKIAKCEATARKRAANGGPRRCRQARGRAWPMHYWESEWYDSDYLSDEFEPWFL